jgi:transposase
MALHVRRLTEEEQEELARARRSQDATAARRARIMLLSARGKRAAQIAEALGMHLRSVYRVLRRANRGEVAAVLHPKRKRPGPVPRVGEEQLARLLELMHRCPADYGLATQRWTLSDLTAVAVRRGIIPALDPSQLWRVLTTHGHNWKQAKRRMTSPDPDYEEKKGCASR